MSSSKKSVPKQNSFSSKNSEIQLKLNAQSLKRPSSDLSALQTYLENVSNWICRYLFTPKSSSSHIPQIPHFAELNYLVPACENLRSSLLLTRKAITSKSSLVEGKIRDLSYDHKNALKKLKLFKDEFYKPSSFNFV